ncbi:MAG: pitrilysin family protein [Trueperaceae bacterium]
MSDQLRFDHTVLPNGLTVIGEHNPRAQSAAVGYMVHAGSRDETADIAGVSHFLEHMMFKGNERLSADDINRTFDELGADYNAYTSEERTVYYGAVPADRAGALLDLLSELMRPSLRQEDFDMEKKVILEEIAMYQDRPAQRLFELANERFWNGHPLGNSVLGSKESVGGLQQSAMRAYFEQRYAPGNVCLVLAGNYQWNELLERAEAATAGWRDYEVSREKNAPLHKAGYDSVADATLNRRHTALFAPGLAVEDPQRFAASILANAIGDGSGSRLYWELVDKGLTDSAWLSHESSEGAGAFVGYLSADPGRADEVLKRFKGVLAEVQQGGISAEEWRRSQRKIATSLTFRAETPLGRLMSFGTYFQTLGSYMSVNEMVEQVMSTPPEAGAEILAERPFDASFVMSLGPG